MRSHVKHLWLGLALIAVASGVLLLSDLDRRRDSGRQTERPRLAILQWTSTDLLDHTVAGIVEGLRGQGFENGRTAAIRFFNAGGDIAAANLMAKETTGGAYDMVLTASTLSLQTVAAANRDRKVPHVFGAVTDPYHAGVGITGPEPDQHPPHLAGVGTFQPVDSAIRIAREMNPGLSRLGTVWNPAEDNSSACVEIARGTCQSLGITLVEANAGNTSEVAEAVRSLLSRNVEAIWIGGDTVAMAAIRTILGTAEQGKIPVFSNDPSDAGRGALFGLGASYLQVGRQVGDIGGRILRGANPGAFGVSNMVPEMLALNETVAKGMDQWILREAHRAMARATAIAWAPPVRNPEPGRVYNAGLLSFGPNPVFEMAENGVRESLAAAGFIEGSNLTVRAMHANNDMSVLPQVVQRMADQKPDVLVVLSTPCLAAVLSGVRDLPIVFGVVSAPLEVGAGESFERHLPHVTGAVWTAPAPEAFAWIKRLFPHSRTLGILYNPVHANSLVEAAAIRSLCGEYGLALEERNVGSPAESVEAIQALLQAGPDLVFALGDNTVVSAFSAVAQACMKKKVPLVATDASLMGSGALFSVGGSPLLEGRHAGRIAARVLLGENPADIPFAPSTEMETTVDLAAARELGVNLPPALLQSAEYFYHMRSVRGRPARIAMINLVQARVLELGEQGVLRGLRDSGLVETEDFVLRRFNAQGEISQLPVLLDAARLENPDIIVTITTPAMVAAVHRVHDIPIVYTIASDPIALKVCAPESIPGNLAGVHDDPPVARLLEMAMKHDPSLSSVGIVYDPAQPNSVISVEKLRVACQEQGMRLHEATASSLTDLSTATHSLVQRQTGALLLSADNLVNSGFSVIQAIAAKQGIPIFVTDVNLIEEGATGGIGDDYESWGAQSGRIAAKVLAGLSPRDVPLQTTRHQIVYPPRRQDVP